MTREEWYKHTTADHIEAVSEYVQIMLDGAMETDMKAEDIEQMYHWLTVLQYDISKQLKEFTHNEV